MNTQPPARNVQRMHTGRAQILAGFVLLTAAIGLHWFEYVLKGEGGSSIWFLLWPLTPYLLCMVEFALSASGLPALAAAVVAFALDAVALAAVIVNPTAFAWSVSLMLTPLFNTVLIVPASIVIGRFVLRRSCDRAR